MHSPRSAPLPSVPLNSFSPRLSRRVAFTDRDGDKRRVKEEGLDRPRTWGDKEETFEALEILGASEFTDLRARRGKSVD